MTGSLEFGCLSTGDDEESLSYLPPDSGEDPR